MPKLCYDCGNELVLKEGTYHFEPPPNIPGGTMIIPNSVWFECNVCGEHLLPHVLDNKLQELAIERTAYAQYAEKHEEESE